MSESGKEKLLKRREDFIIIFSAISRNPIVYNNAGVKTQSADRCHAQTISLPYKGKEKACEGK
ncbi:MAG: hypothetical protein K6G83_08950 [Lachnospiraceae bacterium]|nr:hypothetical protein [Lachnospiraceae bacterium]